MKQWEYKVELLHSISMTEDDLNDLGEDGWELVNIYKEDGSWYAVLKRPL